MARTIALEVTVEDLHTFMDEHEVMLCSSSRKSKRIYWRPRAEFPFVLFVMGEKDREFTELQYAVKAFNEV